MKLSDCRSYSEVKALVNNNDHLYVVEYLSDGLYEVQKLLTNDPLLSIEQQDENEYWLIYNTSEIQEAFTTLEEAEDELKFMGEDFVHREENDIPLYWGQQEKNKVDTTVSNKKWNVVYQIRRTLDVIVEAPTREAAIRKVEKMGEDLKITEIDCEVVQSGVFDVWELKED